MRKTTNHQRARQRTITRRRHKRGPHPTVSPLNLKQYQPFFGSGDITLMAPRDFVLSSNYDETVRYLSSIRRQIGKPISRSHHNLLIVDLVRVRRIDAATALCLVAELDRWQRTCNLKLQPRTVPSWRARVRKQLSEMGFFQLLDTPSPPVIHVSGNGAIRWLPFTSGVSSDGALVRKLRDAFADAGRSIETAWHRIYRPLIEAMNNAVEHAYPEVSHSSIGGARWWLSGTLDQIEGSVTLLFLDQGIGIQNSIKRQPLVTRVLERILKQDRPGEWIAAAIDLGQDGAHIRSLLEEAIRLGASRTGKPFRGKGLADIRALVGTDPRNSVQIISHNGSYTYQPGQAPLVASRAQPFQGTLIQWKLYLSSLPNDQR